MPRVAYTIVGAWKQQTFAKAADSAKFSIYSSKSSVKNNPESNQMIRSSTKI